MDDIGAMLLPLSRLALWNRHGVPPALSACHLPKLIATHEPQSIVAHGPLTPRIGLNLARVRSVRRSLDDDLFLPRTTQAGRVAISPLSDASFRIVHEPPSTRAHRWDRCRSLHASSSLARNSAYASRRPSNPSLKPSTSNPDISPSVPRRSQECHAMPAGRLCGMRTLASMRCQDTATFHHASRARRAYSAQRRTRALVGRYRFVGFDQPNRPGTGHERASCVSNVA